MSYHSFTNVLEYIPKKYVGLSSKQLQDRQAVYSFKEGNCPSYAKEQLLDKIEGIIRSNPSAWVVCFIPASTKSKHIRRYSSLSAYLNSHLGCPVYIDGIDVAYCIVECLLSRWFGARRSWLSRHCRLLVVLNRSCMIIVL